MDNYTKANSKNSNDNSFIQKERQLLIDAKKHGKLASLLAFTKLSGPGWLQSAATLGGGSLASSLYLGVIAGTSMLWLQPLALVFGIIMLSAISYVTLSAKERPFQAINRYINPLFGWSWAITVLIANLVWSLPQFSLATATVRQNILSNIVSDRTIPEGLEKFIICSVIMAVCLFIALFSGKGYKSSKIFDTVLKLMVATIVISFFGVVAKISIGGNIPNWNKIIHGFVPDLSLLMEPVNTLKPFISEVDLRFHDFWKSVIVSQQRDIIITAASAAIGINLTFLMPYSLLKRGWDREFRSLTIFDLVIGMFIPFLLAVSCVTITSASRFHTHPAIEFREESTQLDEKIKTEKSIIERYNRLALERIKFEVGDDVFVELPAEEKQKLITDLPVADKQLCAILVKRDAFDLAKSLSPLTGEIIAHFIFGIGVIGMAMSSIIIIMLINGFVICEMAGVESKSSLYRLGLFITCVGMLGPFVWTGGKAQFWLAVPTAMFSMVLLPVAYFVFFFLMNQKSFLGDEMPRGSKRMLWNFLMGIAASFSAFGCIYTLWLKMRWVGICTFIVFTLLALVVQILRSKRRSSYLT